MSLTNEISFISVENQNQDFPRHFHETFCISLIRSGIEKLELENQFLYSQENCISITNPFEVHSNPLADNDTNVSFDTLYVSPELMAHMLKGKHIEFLDRQIRNNDLNQTFIQLLNSLKSGANHSSEYALTDFIHRLQPHAYNSRNEKTSGFRSDYLSELIHYIEDHIEDKFYLEELAKMMHLNKFGFSKKFKALTGMSPMSYVLMKKVFSAKSEIRPDSDLTDIAYAYNFTDMAHFSHSFKKYVGLSPKLYRDRIER
ncbi:AraC family transcriptional regulator [Fluviicola sp.]|uniref:AraC family transcriptional regulator n=1 Tax=Fluviicola sp. TaxID=1917219 RepID=UPI0031D798F9